MSINILSITTKVVGVYSRGYFIPNHFMWLAQYQIDLREKRLIQDTCKMALKGLGLIVYYPRDEDFPPKKTGEEPFCEASVGGPFRCRYLYTFP